MPRPQRIEYEGAFYHVMNRGRGRQTIFHDAQYYEGFLDTLGEACQRFHGVIHGYCLMGNHYHLLVETPAGNLGRIMRHINGVYAQRHNRMRGTDGPLFRGRYKALLVDQDAYLLQLSRYIHRNPIDGKQPLVEDLATYRWSSYQAYINKAPTPVWLERDKTYAMLGHEQRYRGYAAYVVQGVDDDLAKFYHRSNLASIVGGMDFRTWVYDRLLPELEAEQRAVVVHPNLSMECVVNGVAEYMSTTPEQLRTVVKGPAKGSDARKNAMYLCQEMAGVRLREIAEYFMLNHVGSVSFISHQIRQRKRSERHFSRLIEAVIGCIVKQVT